MKTNAARSATRASEDAADLVIWPPATTEFAEALDALKPAALPDVRLEGSAQKVVAMLRDFSGGEGPPCLAWLLGDAARLASRFAATSGTRRLALKLEPVATDACRLLHHDYVPLRLVCTYRGPGTEWLPREHEATLGAERRDVPAGLLRRVPRFAAALFTGRLMPGARPLLHRSPPVAGTGETRVVLTINAPVEPLAVAPAAAGPIV